MARIVTLKDVRQRRKDIASTIAELQAEDAELEVAERALSRLAGSSKAEPVGLRWGKPGVPKPTPQKPGDIPTVPRMITLALKDALANGKNGLEPKEITDFIRKTWWPEVDINKVGPIAWRMWDRNELTKRGSKYSLKPEAPNVEQDDAANVSG